MDSFPDYYAVLEVTSDATEEEIREAYKRQAVLNHPDRYELDEAVTQDTAPPGTIPHPSRTELILVFQRIADAYYVLSDRTRREQYDEARRQHLVNPQLSTSTDLTLANPTTDSTELFSNVFEEILRPEVERPRWIWQPTGFVAGGVLGFIVANIPGAIVGAYGGHYLGAIRDNKGTSVYDAFCKLSRRQRSAILSHLSVRILGGAITGTGGLIAAETNAGPSQSPRWRFW